MDKTITAKTPDKDNLVRSDTLNVYQEPDSPIKQKMYKQIHSINDKTISYQEIDAYGKHVGGVLKEIPV